MGHLQGSGTTFVGRVHAIAHSAWIALSLLMTACGFPRPADVGDDATVATAGCMRDQDCSGTTPVCVDTVCAVCRTSDMCPASRPVCDMVSHDCRSCAKDSECDS